MPSSVGIETIYLSDGAVPHAFLRECGVPENFIAYASSLVTTPLEFNSCFVSYSAHDQGFCDRLVRDLRRQRVRTWYFPDSATWGKTVWGEIDQGIKRFDKTILICSQRSLTSGPVLRELERALEREDRENRDVLFPIRIDDYVLHSWQHPRRSDVVRKVVGDFSAWTDEASYRMALSRLLDALR
jgi:hypothetical protein